MTALMRQTYDNLSQKDKEQLLLDLGHRCQMTLKEYRQFVRYGQSLYTAVYQKDGSEFVFIPGNTVTLGYNSQEQILDKELVQTLYWDLNEGDDEADEDDADGADDTVANSAVTEFLASVMTPTREVVIKPMLVERQLQSIGWMEVSPESEIMAGYQEEVADFKQSHYNESTHVGRLKLCRTEDGIKAYVYRKISYQALLDQLADQGYSLPSYDEWEYLCGGGSGSLFPWGNAWDETMRTPYGYYVEDDEKMLTSDITDANFFGLYIGYDPYRCEFTLPGPSGEMTKGGDGGVMLCGGSSLELGFLSCAPAFRQYPFDEKWWDEADIGGDYSFYRRVIRVAE